MIVIVFTLALAPAARAASQYKVLHAFNGSDGESPVAGLILDAAGNLYGTTDSGGAYGPGTVFKLTPNSDGSWTESVLYSFKGGSDGGNPDAGLISDAAGNLYSTTNRGGDLSQCSPYGCGTVFKLTPNADGSWTESVLYNFKGINFVNPNGLILDAAGNLYGTTRDGGPGNNCGGSGCGTAFKLTANADGSWTESVLHVFNNKDGDGSGPSSSLIFDAAGNLYGTTWFGGHVTRLCGGLGCGVVFRLTPNADGSWTESVLHDFNGRDGVSPNTGLIFDAAGSLYGTTLNGGVNQLGTVFKLTQNADGSWMESMLHRFRGNPASTPLGVLVFDGAGNLYGTASSRTSEHEGSVFILSPNQDGSWTYGLAHVFQGTPALRPDAGLVLGSAGTLYGTTAGCGTGCKGVVYQITP
jgi:uncharacterized repeat protein (TIGR03803 family)